MSRLVWVLFTLISVFVGFAQAAPRRVALVIGQNYESGGLSKLANPVADATRMAQLLVQHGFDVIKCDGVRPGCFDQNRLGLLGALAKLELAAQNADLAFVFYAGHGMESEVGNIVAPTDVEIDCGTWRVKNGVLLDQIVLAVNGARQKIIVLDACRNDPIKKCPPIVDPPSLSFKDIKIPDADEFLLVTSTKPGQTASDGPKGKHSPFARALFDTLEAHPHIYFDQAFNRVAKSVYDGTKAQPRAQIPETLARGGAPETCLAGRECATDPSGAVFQRELSALKTTLSSEFAALRKEDHFATLDRAKRDMPQGNQGQVAALEQIVTSGYGFKAADLSGISFKGAKLTGAELTAANLEGSDFGEAEIVTSDLSNASMEFVQLRGAHLVDTKLDNVFSVFADAEGLRISGEMRSLKRSNWYGANLKGADLSGADLSGASFAAADLRGANLSNAKLRNTLLIGAQFDASTKFEGATFENTDISSAVGLKDLLSEQQKAGVCARPAREGAVFGFNYNIVEPIPSGAFGGGYEYRELQTYDHQPYIRATAHLSNPRCRPLDEAELPAREPPLFLGLINGDLGFRLSHKLLESGRRGQIRETIKSVKERVVSLVKEEDFLRTDTREIDRVLHHMRASLQNLSKPEFVCFDRSGDLFKLASSGHVEQSDDLVRLWASHRAYMEQWLRTDYEFLAPDIGGAENLSALKRAINPWGEFFPPGYPPDMITFEIVKAFREWNARRLELLGGKVSLCMFPYLKDGGGGNVPSHLHKLTPGYWTWYWKSEQPQWKSLKPPGGEVVLFVDEPHSSYLPHMRNTAYRIRGDFAAELADLANSQGAKTNTHWQRWDMRIDGAEVVTQHSMIVLDLSKDKVHDQLKFGAQR